MADRDLVTRLNAAVVALVKDYGYGDNPENVLKAITDAIAALSQQAQGRDAVLDEVTVFAKNALHVDPATTLQDFIDGLDRLKSSPAADATVPTLDDVYDVSRHAAGCTCQMCQYGPTPPAQPAADAATLEPPQTPDGLRYGVGFSKDGERIDPTTVYIDATQHGNGVYGPCMHPGCPAKATMWAECSVHRVQACVDHKFWAAEEARQRDLAECNHDALKWGDPCAGCGYERTPI